MRPSSRRCASWWEALRAKASHLSADRLELLAGLNDCAAPLRLAVIPNLPETYGTEPRLFPQTPSFSNFSTDMALPLKAGLWASEEFRTQSLAWSEKLMRFCEVRCSELPARARERWGSKSEWRRGLVELAVLFLESHRATGDLRHINAAIKLQELRIGLPSFRNESESAILLLRAALQTEALPHNLEEST